MSETVSVTAVDTSKPLPGDTVTGPRWWAGRDAVMIYLLVAFLLFAAIAVPRFATPVTVGFLLLDVVAVLLIAMPMTLIIITGEIDLSVASIAGLTSAVLGVLWAGGMGIWAAIAVALLCGLAAGALNGVLIAYLGLPSLAVTIGTLALFRGLALVIIGDDAVANFPVEVTALASARLGASGIPLIMIPVALLVLLTGLVLHRTAFGRGLYAMGYSKDAARFVGINVNRSKFVLYLTSGLVSAAAGIFWTFRYTSARSDNASGLELTVIAAVLLGGVSIFGGKGTVPGVVAGVLLIGSLNYALRLDRVSDVVLVTVTGVLLIASVVAPSIGAAIGKWRHTRRLRHQLALPDPA
ncbi:UNVERIFIED_CONTAM: ABC transporter permease [Kocuria sp. CPCC 205316]|uniref:ABC transporter permease n=1 Tax=Kocuria TaxID=57493 RepID=UPI0036D9EB0B